MAANKVEKGSLRKKASVKNSLGNPYVLSWPTIEKQVYYSIINEIRRTFPAVLSRRSVSKARRKQLETTDKDALTEEDKILIQQMKEKQELRKCLAVGINEVTRGYEKDELKLVLACRSIKPSSVTDHFMLLGATRQVPTLGLHDLGQVLGPLLQYNKTAALGFKKQDKETAFDSLVEFIIPMVPEINVPWLKPFEETKQETFSNEGCTIQGQANKAGQQAGVKRRHSDESGNSEDSVINKKQKADKDVKLNVVEEEKPKETLRQLDEEIQDNKKKESQNITVENSKLNNKTKSKEGNSGQIFAQKERKNVEHKSELGKISISFEPIVIKQILPNPDKNRTGKRKKTKSKAK
ncbi:ribonuclease P protein subunit p38-like [Actinia tenebrosa]|uniref:Ribonuclease P protein subunit p38-like n=1 Tax=Actinia tenebrosa TaxID=6105 RepID=A0A6P8IR70_ACTTE|nr:ribonuclease P protein subunit p38-like [Actinia tenebrosa]